MTEFAMIQPGTYTDPDSGESICISLSPYYSKITIAGRDWYFIRETGRFDGTSVTLVSNGPFLVSESGERQPKEGPASSHKTTGRER